MTLQVGFIKGYEGHGDSSICYLDGWLEFGIPMPDIVLMLLIFMIIKSEDAQSVLRNP